MAIIDQYTDSTFAYLYHLVKDRPQLEEYIKEAEVHESEASTLPDTAFAWPEKRAFPIHTKESTTLSSIYRENVSDVPSYVDDTLKVARDIYGIDDAVFARPKLAAVEDLPDDYLLPELKKIRVKTAADVKTAEKVLLRDYTKLSVMNRATACVNLVKKAEEFKVELASPIQKLAGTTISSTKILVDWLEARREATPREIYKVAFQKLADGVKKMPAEIRDRDVLVKLADSISELDEKAGLTKFYDRKLPDPMNTVFNTDKTASSGVDLNGKYVSAVRLASYGQDFYNDMLGEDLVSEASDGSGGLDPQKLATILETLPRDLKAILANQIR